MSMASPQQRSLVVGASGQIGFQLVSALGRGRTVCTSRQPRNPGWINLDLGSLAKEDARDLIRKLAVRAVYCVGGMTDVEACESDPQLAIRVNCQGPEVLASAAAELGIPFVYFSSEYVFNGNAGPYSEDALADPISAYGRSKWAGELAVLQAHPQALIIRTTVVYGPDPGAKNFLHSLWRACIESRPLRVAADQISTPTYNCDLAAASVLLVNAGATGVCHVCGPERMSRLEFAYRAAAGMGLDASCISGVPTAEMGQRAPRPLKAGLVSERLNRQFQDFRMRGIDQAIRHWRANGGLPGSVHHDSLPRFELEEFQA